MQGIVIIDELDAHMHIDLQMEAIPKLTRLFPRIQFVVSSHSPFLALGMEKEFSSTGVRVLELPSGMAVNAETYEEFGKALEVVRETSAFTDAIADFVRSGEASLIWVAGETDLLYFQTAARLLGFPNLVDLFAWVGAPGQSGGGRQTGDNGLKSAIKFLRANPEFVRRKIIAIFDNDANQPEEVFESVHVISLPKIEGAHCDKGIENLLPLAVFTDEMYEEKEIPSGYGRPKIIPGLRKTLLCERLCGENADSANFQNFGPILERINEIVAAETGGVADESDASSTDGGTAE
jgi:hypothetical protein